VKTTNSIIPLLNKINYLSVQFVYIDLSKFLHLLIIVLMNVIVLYFTTLKHSIPNLSIIYVKSIYILIFFLCGNL